MGFPDAFGPAEHAELVERIDRSGEFDGTELLLGIQVDGRLAGEVQARQPRMGLPPGVFELGIDLFDEADRGRGIGRDRAHPAADAVVRAGGRAPRPAHDRRRQRGDADACPNGSGFGFEGVMRSFMPSTDGPRDYAMYAMTRDDYEDVKTRWT